MSFSVLVVEMCSGERREVSASGENDNSRLSFQRQALLKTSGENRDDNPPTALPANVTPIYPGYVLTDCRPAALF
jgi:hypothetical protein